MSKAFGFLIPVGFVLLFFLGIPLGYKLILGDRKSTVKEGRIQDIRLIHDNVNEHLNGKEARVISDYVVIELEGDRELWIPEENVAGIVFLPKP